MEQWTLDAVGVLIISPTAGGGGLGRLRCNVDSEGGKYTSATYLCPRINVCMTAMCVLVLSTWGSYTCHLYKNG